MFLLPFKRFRGLGGLTFLEVFKMFFEAFKVFSLGQVELYIVPAMACRLTATEKGETVVSWSCALLTVSMLFLCILSYIFD